MELNKFQRLILINQYSILGILDPENGKEYELNKEILMQGYKNHYGDLVEWVMDDVPEEKSKEVLDILQMYRSLNFSFLNLKDEEKEKVEEGKLKFRGFDGNNETTYMAYARFFMHEMDRYRELWDGEKYPDYNTHTQMLDKYRRMLAVWKEISESYNNNLSAEEINKIVEA